MPDSLSVLQVLPALVAGGVEQGTLETARALVQHGHRSHVLSAGGPLVASLEAQGSVHHCLPVGRKSPLTLLLAAKLRRLITTVGADIIHVHSRMPAWVIHHALRRMPNRPRLISTVHGRYRVNWYSRIMTRSDYVIAVSDFIHRYVLSNYPATDERRLRVIHNGVSAAQFPRGHRPDPRWLKAWRKAWPVLHNRPLITLPGRITRRKGHEQFIDILDKLREEKPEIAGVIAGGAHPRQQGFLGALRKTVRDRGLTEHLVFAGHRDDLRELMSISSVVLSLAREPEAFGRAVLEALSLGVPVVAYDHGGASEILGRLLPEGLVPLGSRGAAVERILGFLRAPPRIRDNVNGLTLERSLEKTLELYAAAHAGT